MSTYTSVFHQFEKGFFGSCAIGILVQSCIGGVAAMAILQHGNSVIQMIQLFLVVAACITFNGSILSLQKPKVVFNLFIGSSLLCTVLTVVNFLT